MNKNPLPNRFRIRGDIILFLASFKKKSAAAGLADCNKLQDVFFKIGFRVTRVKCYMTFDLEW